MSNWLVVGSQGSGKTSFSKKLAFKKELHLIELDDYVWDKNWKEVTDKELNKRINKQIKVAKDGFVLEGVRVDKLSAETIETIQNIIVLDVALYISYTRAIKRNLKRLFTQERICGDNHETVLSFCYTLFVTFAKNKHRRTMFFQLYNKTTEGKKLVFKTNEAADEWLIDTEGMK